MTASYTQENYSLDESIGYLISRARAVLTANFDKALAEFDMTHAQYGIFRKLLDARDDMTAGDLAREWCYDTGAMTRMLDRLEEKGLLARERSPADRRVVLVRLTDKGRALAGRLSQVAIDALNRHLQGFSAEEVGQLKDLLRRLIANG